MSIKNSLPLLALLGLATFVGCGSEVPVYPVTGTVTNAGGDPIEGAAVSFVPDSGGELAVGVTGADGTYTLKTGVRDGAQVGSYKISIAKYEGGDTDFDTAVDSASDPMDITDEYPDDYNEAAENAAEDKASVNNLPEKYSNPESSGLTASVAEGDNTFDFKVE